MVEKIISSIIEAEEKAANEIRAAHIAEKEIHLKADSEAESIKEEYLKQIKEEVKAITQKAEKAATEKSDKIIASGKEDAEKLIKSVEKKQSKAVDMVVERILSKYGNS